MLFKYGSLEAFLTEKWLLVKKGKQNASGRSGSRSVVPHYTCVSLGTEGGNDTFRNVCTSM